MEERGSLALQEARTGEIESLQKAKAVLSGADFSLLQKQALAAPCVAVDAFFEAMCGDLVSLSPQRAEIRLPLRRTRSLLHTAHNGSDDDDDDCQ